MIRIWAPLLLAILAAGCSESSTTPADAALDRGGVDLAWPADHQVERPGDGQPADAAAADGAAADLAADAAPQPDPATVWPPPPSSYDCTSVTGAQPKRVNTVPLGCIIDPTCTTTLVTGHRGVGVDSQEVLGFYVPIGRYAPENTLSSVRAAIAMGADVVEVDVRSTSDGQLVLMHDDDVARTTTGKGQISQFTLAQVQALKLKTGQFKGDFSCEKVPTFAELLTLTKGLINIDADLKTDATDKVALAVKAAGMIDQVFMSASDSGKLTKARAAVPSIRLQARTDVATQIPTLLALFSPAPEILEIDEAILNAANIATIHAGKAKVFVDGFNYDALGYLNNDPKTYTPLVNKKPDIIQVDRIDLVLKLLGR